MKMKVFEYADDLAFSRPEADGLTDRVFYSHEPGGGFIDNIIIAILHEPGEAPARDQWDADRLFEIIPYRGCGYGDDLIRRLSGPFEIGGGSADIDGDWTGSGHI